MMQQKEYTLFAGQFLITNSSSLISTVLGSCVSVCLWDRVTKMAGMNHYLLPGNEQDDINNMDRGVHSTRLLIRSLINRKCSVEHLEAKVFGGCNSLYQNRDVFRVGERNVEIALNILQSYKIRIKAQDTGGTRGRKIIFNTDTGKVRMKLLTKTASEVNEEINKGFGY
jgi:chemotaxis protein CheD